MSRIAAVKGMLDSSNLGVTLMHEHICFWHSGKVLKPITKSDYMLKAFNNNLSWLKKARDVGINTLVELTPWANVKKIIELNELVPEINIILSTGAYLKGVGPQELSAMSEDEMEDHMTKDLTEGYDGLEYTGVKAGIIKVASKDPTLTEWEKKNFRAAAKVQKKLKVPIATHANTGARAQMQLLRESGADISATFYSHVSTEFGEFADWEGRSLKEQAKYLEDVTKEGGHLQFNNFDFGFYTPFDDMLYLINYLEEKGYGDKIFISIDANFELDEDGRIWLEAEKEHPETGKRTFAYAITNAVPMLMSAGVSLQRINKYLIENPRRFFEHFN